MSSLRVQAGPKYITGIIQRPSWAVWSTVNGKDMKRSEHSTPLSAAKAMVIHAGSCATSDVALFLSDLQRAAEAAMEGYDGPPLHFFVDSKIEEALDRASSFGEDVEDDREPTQEELDDIERMQSAEEEVARDTSADLAAEEAEVKQDETDDDDLGGEA